MKLLIVNFHYFREEVYESGIYPVSALALKRQLDQLGKHYTFIGQTDLLRWLEAGKVENGNYCLITFDDGLKEQMHAFRLLRQMDVPAIFYVPGQPFLEKEVLFVHKLHYVRANRSDREIYDVLATRYSLTDDLFDMDKLRNQYRYDNDMARKVKYFMNFQMSEVDRNLLIETLFQELTDQDQFRRVLYMTHEDLKELAEANALGAHGNTHRPLATLPGDEAKKDIHDSIQCLEEITGTRVRSFAYPYGGRSAVSEDLITCFEGTDVAFALTMWRGFNTSEQFNSRGRYLLHRVDTNDAPGGKQKAETYIP